MLPPQPTPRVIRVRTSREAAHTGRKGHRSLHGFGNESYALAVVLVHRLPEVRVAPGTQHLIFNAQIKREQANEIVYTVAPVFVCREDNGQLN